MIDPKEAAERYPHLFSWNESEGCLELYADNHVLSTLRVCEAKFVEEVLNCLSPKGGNRHWSLEFGQLLHEGLDIFYKSFKETKSAPDFNVFLKEMARRWDIYDMEYYRPDPNVLVSKIKGDQKKYYILGGRTEGKAGFLALLTEYYAFYMNQRLRVVDTEVSFGRNKEVFLGEIWIELVSDSYWYGRFKVKVYLSGRIDLLVDNGYKIGPVDHKSTIKFDGYESNDFDPHDGISGYIYAINDILKNRFPENPHKICNTGWIHHISISQDTPRFKPTYISKTNEQLEAYRLRQLRTSKRLVELALGEPADWNTQACNNIYNTSCPLKELHRQPPIQRENTIKQFYEIREAWNPANPPSIQARGTNNGNNNQLGSTEERRNVQDSCEVKAANGSSNTNGV